MRGYDKISCDVMVEQLFGLQIKSTCIASQYKKFNPMVTNKKRAQWEHLSPDSKDSSVEFPMSPKMDFGQNLTLQHHTPLPASPGAI